MKMKNTLTLSFLLLSISCFSQKGKDLVNGILNEKIVNDYASACPDCSSFEEFSLQNVHFRTWASFLIARKNSPTGIVYSFYSCTYANPLFKKLEISELTEDRGAGAFKMIAKLKNTTTNDVFEVRFGGIKTTDNFVKARKIAGNLNVPFDGFYLRTNFYSIN